jgi:hypothetical protein
MTKSDDEIQQEAEAAIEAALQEMTARAEAKIAAEGRTAPPSDLAPDLETLAEFERAQALRRADMRERYGKPSERGAQAPVAPPVAIPAPPPTAASVNETALATPVVHIDPLPFTQGDGAAPPPAAMGPGDQAGETAFLPPIEGLDIPDPSDVPELSVEQYASLCVERTVNPAAAGEAAKRYRVLTEQALQSLDEQWRSRFSAEGELQQRYQQAYAQYEAWLKRQK